MSEAISLKGLRLLSEMEESKRPEDWKVLVINYLQHKEDWINSNPDHKEDSYNLGVFIEALKMTDKMGIVWKVRIR